jgi:hypothetical protein
MSITRGLQQHLLKSFFFYLVFIDLGGKLRVVIMPLKGFQGGLSQGGRFAAPPCGVILADFGVLTM